MLEIRLFYSHPRKGTKFDFVWGYFVRGDSVQGDFGWGDFVLALAKHQQTYTCLPPARHQQKSEQARGRSGCGTPDPTRTHQWGPQEGSPWCSCQVPDVGAALGLDPEVQNTVGAESLYV